MSTRVMLEPAFILHRRPYSNTSLIIDLLTLNHGRISALAKSARGLKSRYRGILEMFSPLLVSWTGHRDLKLLGQVELNGMPCLLEGEALLCGFYLNELLVRVLHREDPYQQLFHRYQDALQQLVTPISCERSLRIFEKYLLHELGYGLPLHVTIEPHYYYQYVPDQGFRCVVQPSVDSTAFLGTSLIALRDEYLQDETSLDDAKRLMRIAIQRLLGGKSLKSRDLWGWQNK